MRSNFFIAVLFSLFLVGCRGNDPGTVAEKFLTNVAKGDLETAKKYCDSTTKELLDQADYLAVIPDSIKEEGRKLKVNIISTKKLSDKAVVTYTTSKLNENQVITLVKIDGKWLVQLNKSDQYDDEIPAEQPMPETTDSAATTVIDTSYVR